MDPPPNPKRRQTIAVTLTLVSDIIGFILNAMGAWFRIEWLFTMGIIIFFGSVIVFAILYFGHDKNLRS
jgi:hypothetical protein